MSLGQFLLGVVAAVPAGTAAGTFPATFIGISPSWRLAVYSAANGRLLKYLTAAEPGGPPEDPQLSADGRTVAFVRFGGTCTGSLDTVPAGGGAERVLIPPTPAGGIPFAPSYSADGTYLIYATVIPCSPPHTRTIHVRDLRTGRQLAGPGTLGWDAVFINHDRQVVSGGPAGLTVRQLPSLRARAYPAPRGCRYQGLAGTETELAGLLQCGARDALSVVAISPATFAITRTLTRLGTCLGGSISAAGQDPPAILVETQGACLPPTAVPTVRILTIRGAQTSVVLSGPAPVTPTSAIW